VQSNIELQGNDMGQLGQLVDRMEKQQSQHDTLWIGLCGSPGSGKSTLAEGLKRYLGDQLTVIPMDGYHFSRAQLAHFDQPEQAFARRGAPFTFDAHQMVTDLTQAKRLGLGHFPSFDHHHGDPVADAIKLQKDTPFVLVEGNYLLLNSSPWTKLKHHVFHDTWFLNVPVEECCRRVYQRHMATGLSSDEAQKRVNENDRLNAQLITDQSLMNADLIIAMAS